MGPGEPSDPAQKPPAAGPARAPGRGLCRTLPPEGLWAGRCAAPALTSPHEPSPRTGHLSPDVATAAPTQRPHERTTRTGRTPLPQPVEEPGLAHRQPSIPPHRGSGDPHTPGPRPPQSHSPAPGAPDAHLSPKPLPSWCFSGAWAQQGGPAQGNITPSITRPTGPSGVSHLLTRALLCL